MAAVRGLRVSVKAEASAGLALGLPSPEAESGLERGEPEPMEVEEGELEMVPVRRSLKELIPVREARGEVAGRASVPRLDGPEGEAAGCPAAESRGKERGERAPGGRGRPAGETRSERKDAGRPEMGAEGLRGVGALEGGEGRPLPAPRSQPVPGGERGGAGLSGREPNPERPGPRGTVSGRHPGLLAVPLRAAGVW